MSRWNDTIILLSPTEAYQDSAGAWHEGKRTQREIFCNPMTVGSMVLAQLRSSDVRTTSGEKSPDVGMQVAAIVQIRAIDYEYEDQAIYKGKEMRILAATEDGEKMKLYLQRTIGNNENDSTTQPETQGETDG